MSYIKKVMLIILALALPTLVIYADVDIPEEYEEKVVTIPSTDKLIYQNGFYSI